MASESIKDILEWAETDNKRFLHVVYRVGDLEKTIKLANLLALCICYEWYLCFLDDSHSPIAEVLIQGIPCIMICEHGKS